MIEQAAGRGDQHINTLVDQLVLLFERDTTDQQSFGKLEIFGIGIKVFCHLCRQFAGRAEHKAARHPGAGAAPGKKRQHG